MSEEERQATAEQLSQSEPEEDLFGDDSDSEDENNDNIDTSSPSKKLHKTKKSSYGIDAADSNSDSEEGKEDSEEEEEEEDIQRAELILPRHPRSHEVTKEILNFNLPRFLFVDPEPFAPTNFESQLNDFLQDNTKGRTNKELQDSIEFKKLELLNTIRWRYAKTENNELYKQSNTKIVEWEDGSLSFKIGKEYFDIRPKKNEDEILAFQGGQVLVASNTLGQSIQVLPSSTSSKAHKILASTLQSNLKLKKAKKINTIVTREDPELKAREMEKAQKEIERARRRQILKMQLEAERLERKSGTPTQSRSSAAFRGIDIGDSSDDEGTYYKSRRSGNGKRAREDEYDEEDDFVADDDEDVESGLDDDELEAAEQRLKQVKRDGAKKYSSPSPTVEGYEDDDEEEAVVTKKRRVIIDEDDDDE